MSAVQLPLYSYTWIFVLTMIFAFLDAFSIGANDVANSFATSVGSRSLTLFGAVCIAIFTEFGGAIALGASTTSTVKDGIININMFSSRPDLLMSGFMCALISSSSWVMFATRMGWPVSTTHSIIGALVGIGVSAYGFSAVNWGWNNKGVAQVAAAWAISPVVAGVIAALVYLFTLFVVMKSKNSLVRGIWCIPVYFIITIFIVSFYVVSKNGQSTLSFKPAYPGGPITVSGNVGLAFGIIGAITGAAAIFSIGFLVPYFYRRLVKEEKLTWYHMFTIWFTREQPHDPLVQLQMKLKFTPHLLTDEERKELDIDGPEEEEEQLQKDGAETEDKEVEEEEAKPRNTFLWPFLAAKRWLFGILFMDVSSMQHMSKYAQKAHATAIVYDPKTEYLYSLLQICTAAFASFSHGSNDVANALGPLAGVYQIWSTGDASKNASVPTWMLAYAGAGIDFGLALYGYNIMKSLGNNITFHSPSRGFSMELGAALAVVTASFLALPVSTTQCIVGATVAVGLCNGSFRTINWQMFAWAVFSWVLTLPFASVCAGLLYALLTRGPSFTLPPS